MESTINTCTYPKLRGHMRLWKTQEPLLFSKHLFSLCNNLTWQPNSPASYPASPWQPHSLNMLCSSTSQEHLAESFPCFRTQSQSGPSCLWLSAPFLWTKQIKRFKSLNKEESGRWFLPPFTKDQHRKAGNYRTYPIWDSVLSNFWLNQLEMFSVFLCVCMLSCCMGVGVQQEPHGSIIPLLKYSSRP